MSLTATWTAKQYHENGAYKVVTSATLTNDEADRFYELWVSSFVSGVLTATTDLAAVTTTGGIIYKTRDVNGNDTKITCIGYGIDPEDVHEHLLKNIKAVLLALTATDTAVTEANAASGEIEDYGVAISLTVSIGTP